MNTKDLELFNNILNEIDNNSNRNDICLISNNKLENNYIKLDCGHCFNYIPLYNEVVYQKTKKILDNKYLKLNEIKCPYCRSKTNKLLPYYKYYNIKYIRGVHNSESNCFSNNKCVIYKIQGLNKIK